MSLTHERDLRDIDSGLVSARKMLAKAMMLLREAKQKAKANCGAPDPDRFVNREDAAGHAEDHIDRAIYALDEVVE